MMNRNLIFTVMISLFLFAGCSLKYENSIQVEETTPEFIFNNTTIYRYERKKPSAKITAENIEQYTNSDISYGKNIEFESYDSQMKVNAKGKCGFLSSDSEKDVYLLFDNIEMYSDSKNSTFYADALKWDGTNEQLISSRSDTVKILQDNNVIIGSGFSADGVSGEYVFTGTVSGSFVTEDKKEEQSNQISE